MSKKYKNRPGYVKDRDSDEESWIPVIIMLAVFWPVGLVMLVKRFSRITTEENSNRRSRSTLKGGLFMLAAGALALITDIGSFGMAIFLALGGLFMLGYSTQMKAKQQRFDKYLRVVGTRDVMRLRDIAAAMPVSEEQACKDLEEMIAEGRFPEGAYLDMSTRALVVDGASAAAADFRAAARTVVNVTFEAEPAEPAAPAQAPKKPAEPAKAAEAAPDEPGELTGEYAKKLSEIRRMDEMIQDEAVSEKIRRIGEVTASIFEAVHRKPEKRDQIHSFMNYYLPTTLKLLNAYAELERQKVAGENIRTSKDRIEKMLAQLVFAFEQQLDMMFEADAMDISSDITVLERMMAKDGLSEGPYSLPRHPFKKKNESTTGAAAAQAAEEEDS